MKTYICINHGECSWADEKPPREFSLPESDENVCPNCEKNNIQEASNAPGPPWTKTALAVGLLLLLTGAVWLWGFNGENTTDETLDRRGKPRTTLVLMIDEMNCKTGVLSLRTLKGDGSPVMFGAEGLKLEQSSSSFVIPEDQRRDKKIIFFAVQSKDTVSVEYTTNCPKQLPPPPQITWTRVPGSEFCDPYTECVQFYSERSNLGKIRERRIHNCTECGMAKK